MNDYFLYKYDEILELEEEYEDIQRLRLTNVYIYIISLFLFFTSFKLGKKYKLDY